MSDNESRIRARWMRALAILSLSLSQNSIVFPRCPPPRRRHSRPIDTENADRRTAEPPRVCGTGVPEEIPCDSRSCSSGSPDCWRRMEEVSSRVDGPERRHRHVIPPVRKVLPTHPGPKPSSAVSFQSSPRMHRNHAILPAAAKAAKAAEAEAEAEAARITPSSPSAPLP